MLTKSKNVSFLLLDFNGAPNSEIWIKESVWWRVLWWIARSLASHVVGGWQFSAQHSVHDVRRLRRYLCETSTASTHRLRVVHFFAARPRSPSIFRFFTSLGCAFHCLSFRNRARLWRLWSRSGWARIAVPRKHNRRASWTTNADAAAKALRTTAAEICLWFRQKDNGTDNSQLFANNNNH